MMSNTPVTTADRNLPLIVIGAGGHARVLLDLLRSLGRQVFFITDHDSAQHGRTIEGVLVRGGDDAVFEHAPNSVRLVNGIGSVCLPQIRRRVFERFTKEGYQFATLIHPSATVSQSVRLEQGVQIMANATIQPGVRLGRNTLINTTASIDHDCIVEDHVHIAPGVTLSGNVTVGDTSHLGTGATVIQGVQLGDHVLVGAGAVVVRAVAARTRVIGVPARQVGDADRADMANEPTVGGASPRFNVMLSAAGRRVALLKLLQQSLSELRQDSYVVATDISRCSSAFQLAEVGCLVPSYSSADCLEQMLEICRTHAVRLIVPTIDPDLSFFSQHQRRFEQIGAQIMIGSVETIRICNDKQMTHDWLVAHDFPTMRQTSATALLDDASDWRFPLFAKPRRGSSSTGATVVRDINELRIVTAAGDYIVQELAAGQEYTVDVYVDRQGRCRCAVPRQRLETRGGEVSKGVTVRCEPVQELACHIAEALPGAWGVMNVQVFFDARTQAMQVCEINARFGGGYPLTHQAGAPMTRWMIREAQGLSIDAAKNEWAEGLVMLRYDEAVFVSRDQAGLSVNNVPAAAKSLPSEA
ncbi:NeuD/PglB/VioB family sugar acetyltransferase [Phycisphaerales bacterium AB-hyl4]|uniref:NeuD/PglB/VioB family sugar acetyltransferase n=1 Tax=Natronomicrosphaera hydrolytica TaxID=3242702 RepID=A0ABV4U5T8_9BACT